MTDELFCHIAHPYSIYLNPKINVLDIHASNITILEWPNALGHWLIIREVKEWSQKFYHSKVTKWTSTCERVGYGRHNGLHWTLPSRKPITQNARVSAWNDPGSQGHTPLGWIQWNVNSFSPPGAGFSFWTSRMSPAPNHILIFGQVKLGLQVGFQNWKTMHLCYLGLWSNLWQQPWGSTTQDRDEAVKQSSPPPAREKWELWQCVQRSDWCSCLMVAYSGGMWEVSRSYTRQARRWILKSLEGIQHCHH